MQTIKATAKQNVEIEVNIPMVFKSQKARVVYSVKKGETMAFAHAGDNENEYFVCVTGGCEGLTLHRYDFLNFFKQE